MVQMVPVRGLIDENAYVYIDDATGHGFVIDPGARADLFESLASDHGWVFEKILLTHGHFDHIGAVNDLRELWGVPVVAHGNADRYLTDAEWNLSSEFGQTMTVKDVQKVADGDEVRLEADPDVVFRVIHTPGHTTDSVIYYCEKEKLAFTGDTIFRSSIGNYTFPGGDYATLVKSIRERIFTLPEDTVLLSGHTGPTTVGKEKRFHGFGA